MTTISVIIPTLGEASKLPILVQSLKSQGFEEIIVADASDDTATAIAALRAGAVCLANLAKGRGSQMSAGAQVASCDILFFLHADSALPSNAYAAINSALANQDNVAGSFRLSFDSKHPLLAIYAWFGRFNCLIATYGDQGLFLRRTTYEKIGGFAPIALMEDFEIQQRLRRLGRFVKLQHTITTSARRFMRRGILRQQLLNVVIVLSFLCKVPSATLARWYEGRSS